MANTKYIRTQKYEKCRKFECWSKVFGWQTFQPPGFEAFDRVWMIKFMKIRSGRPNRIDKVKSKWTKCRAKFCEKLVTQHLLHGKQNNWADSSYWIILELVMREKLFFFKTMKITQIIHSHKNESGEARLFMFGSFALPLCTTITAHGNDTK